MTPSMHLHALMGGYPNEPLVRHALEQAYALGHEFGLERAAEIVDRCNKEGHYNAIGAAKRIRALKVTLPEDRPAISEDFL